MIPTTRNCTKWAVPQWQAPPRNYQFWAVLDPGKPLHKNSEIFHGCMHAQTDSHLLFQKWSKLVQGRKAALVAWQTTKHILIPLGGTPGVISPNVLCECALWPLTYILHFIQIRSGLGELYPINSSAIPHLKMSIWEWFVIPRLNWL